MKLLPFSLAQFKSGAVAVTRDGRKVQYVGMMPEDRKIKFPVVGVVDDLEDVWYWTTEGHYTGAGAGNPADLFMMPEKVDGWVNVYRANSGSIEVGAFVHASPVIAWRERRHGADLIASVPFSFYDGEGLDAEPQSKEG